MIYLVMDNPGLREAVKDTLSRSGIASKGYDRPSLFYDALVTEGLPSLVLLDGTLPEEDGLSVLKKLRARDDTKRLPVIILSTRTGEADKVTGLDMGADDYIGKPFGNMELIARIRAVLRRTEPTEEKTSYTAGRLSANPEAHLVTVDGEPVRLTKKEYDVLLLLLRSGESVVTRERLFREVWGYAYEGETRTVDVHIRTLRSKLGAAGNYIETIRGVGYCIRVNEV